MAATSCKTCVYCVPAKDGEGKVLKGSGFCYRHPPQIVGSNASAFPPVNTKSFWCGEHRGKSE